MTSRSPKSLPITVRKEPSIRQANLDGLDRDGFSATSQPRIRGWLDSLIQSGRRRVAGVVIGCLATGLLAGPFSTSQVEAQQSSPRAYAPPVHIAPGSATALPANRHRPRLTPGLEMANTRPQAEPIGIQDRLANSFARKRKSNPTLAREIPIGNARNELVGSGVARPSSERRSTRLQQAERVQSVIELAHDPAMEPTIDGEAFESTLGKVQPVNAQENEAGAPPVRHAFVQEQHLRNLPPQAAAPSQVQVQAEAEFEQEFEWSDEQPNLQMPPRGSQQIYAQQEGVPSRPSSVFRRQDTQRQDDQFQPQQPQPGSATQPPRTDFQQELDQLDRQFENQRGGERPDGDAANPGAPKSLLEDSDDSTDEPDQDDQTIGADKSKTSLLDQTCEEFRSDLLKTSIRDIALDMSPPAINTNQPFMGISRSWTDRNGQIIATGTMIDLRRGYVFLDSGQKISFARLSEADLTAVSEHWNLPKSCLVRASGNVERCWTPQTYFWTASSLCHKPLYFENVQLERYGHTHGPIMQPIRSVGHFFVSLVTLPYQTAIHPANECQYPLGLYRPGDCAPWLKDPIPISLDGIRRQALVTTGLAFIP